MKSSIWILLPLVSSGFGFVNLLPLKLESRKYDPSPFLADSRKPELCTRGGALALTSTRQSKRTEPSKPSPPLFSLPEDNVIQQEPPDTSELNEFEVIKNKRLLGLEYLATGFILGVVVIGMEINLVDFARLCRVPTEQASLALLWRSAGSIAGAGLAGPLMQRFHPHRLAFALLSVVGGLLYTIPIITKLKLLNTSFFGFGLVVSVINTAILLLLRNIFGDTAGVWLQGLSVTYQFGVIAVPALAKYVGLSTQYSVLAGISFAIMVAGLFTAKPKTMEVSGTIASSESTQKKKRSFLTGVDMLIAGANFFLVGIIVNTMTYLRPYMTEVGLDSTLNSKDALLGITLAVLCGQVFSMVTQQRCISLTESYNYLKGFHMAAIAALASLVIAPVLTPRHFLLCGVMGFGLFWGPLIGYMYDVWNRRTKASAFGTAFVTFGGAVGCGLYSFGTFALWKRLKNPNVFFLSNIVAFALSLSLILSTKCNVPAVPEPILIKVNQGEGAEVAAIPT
eukprot:CAMPEP_0117735266 /NCGR_PEP_ID=MMETSP0947-20121206/1197_1 /TAXON_ID=44440 /ORGANISM="Chattonella subsalsa, Strain CCMP2191" /LENGTH=508 /DNA_ID=CAMNT_0005550263 /DNA_START=93 /DNA_END=1619 /DNA_ORIENTATION=+